MIQGVYKFRTDQRIFDMQINRICRLILFVKLRNMISKYLSRTPYVREAPKIGRNETWQW